MVSRGEDQTTTFVRIHHLKYRVYYASQLAMIAAIASLFADGIEFIEECNKWMLGDEIENLAEIGCGFTEKR